METLSRAKLRPPYTRMLRIARPRLTARLDARGMTPVILISATAGFGKSTLVADWIQRAQLNAAWFTLDEADNDPIRFLSYLIEAMQPVNPGFGSAAALLLHSVRLSDLETISSVLEDELNRMTTSGVLVLDDYHVIRNPLVHKIVAGLIQSLPTGLRLVIASRTDPPLPLARMRARAELLELLSADLRFTPSEAADFLISCMGIKLPAESLALLVDRTEGWAVGLQLAALSVQEAADPEQFILSFHGSHRHVVDYLTQEVLQRLTEDMQQFLLRASILNPLCAELCNAVCKREDSQNLLEELEGANLFLIPLDAERRWYRFHTLFADLLQARWLQKDRDQVCLDYQSAADWCEQNGMLTEAVEYARQSGDMNRFTRLLELAADNLIAAGEGQRLLNWLDGLDEGLYRQKPALSLAQAWAGLIVGNFSIVDDRLQRIEEDFHDAMVISEAAAIRSLAASIRQDIPGTICAAEAALAGLPASNELVRCTVSLSLGMAYFLSGRASEAITALQEGLRQSRQLKNKSLELALLHALGQAFEIVGELRRAENVYRELLEFQADPACKGIPLVGLGFVGLGGVLHERGELAEAERILCLSQEWGRRWGSPEILMGYYASMARLLITQRKFDECFSLLNEADHLLRAKHIEAGLKQIAAFQAMLWLHQGRLSRALNWGRTYRAQDLPEPLYLHEIECLTLARLRIAQRRFEEARVWLDQMLAAIHEQNRPSSEIDCLLLVTLLEERAGNPHSAERSLEQALLLSRPQGYRRSFLDEQEWVLPVLQRVSTRGEYTADALPLIQQMSALQQAASPLVELSERERQVLTLMAEGMSNQQIAGQLVVALTTVKTHVKNILIKLEVDNRTRAVARARELNLL